MIYDKLVKMGKTKDSLVISVDKYNMFSPGILIAYGAAWLYDKAYFITPCLHIYHLGRSIYDRFGFHSKCGKTSHFINHDFTKNDAHYILTGMDHDYGLSITEMVSVTGLVSNILGYFGTKNGFKILQSCAQNVGLGKYCQELNDTTGKFIINQDKLKTYSNYALVATMTLTFLNMLIGSSSASLKINYDVFTIDEPVEFCYDELEVVNYPTEISIQ